MQVIEKKGCSWNKFSEFNSIESLDSEQHIERSLVNRKSQKKQPHTRGRVWQVPQSSVRPDLFPPSRLVVRIFLQSWSRPVLSSRDCALEYSFHTKFCLTTHHVVVECQPITVFLNVTHHDVHAFSTCLFVHRARSTERCTV